MSRGGAVLAPLVRLALALAAVSGAARPAVAQHSRVVSGRVVVQRAGDAVPLPGSVVTLHRVGSDAAGAIDSVKSDAKGRYSFSFRPFGAERAVYFAAVLFGGIAYFTSPLGAEATNGEQAEIVVFDTASTGIDISVRGRHLAISSPSTTGNRAVVDVFELGNDSMRTLVQGRASSGQLRATWRMPLPEAALNASVMRDAGDIAAAAVTVTNGEAAVFAPFAPGMKQLALRYEIPAAHDSLTIPLVEATGVLEVLLEEGDARASGGGLADKGAVTVDGRSLHRFLAQDVASTAVLTIALPRARSSSSSRTWWTVALGAIVAAGIAAVLMRAPTRSNAGSQINAETDAD
ncbi:MAG TPA: hypothetical protein VH762_01385 [Gemmatimonadaceae bacterium]